MDWKSHIEGLLKAGATVDLLAVGMGVTPNAVREIRAGRTRSPRADAAFKLAAMTPEQFAAGRQQVRQPISALVDSRMSKRALRARLGLSSDAHLAKVLGLPTEDVAAWPEEASVPAVPHVLNLLGTSGLTCAPDQPSDPDADRIVGVDAA
ncbi:hypothetical protein [Stenotrophomonas sp. 278]|uniref:hypothetical protein n=1 Tax=Stenotrophomonas sp. 278 TaxID=2479851 RepID=UPI00163966C8|nr:hypothetical protein [Stenotrophomonas sp. 278]